MPRRKERARSAWAGVVVMALAISAYSTLLSSGAQAPATIVTHTGKHVLSVEIAATPSEREVGLMNRQSMADDHGMLFDFGDARPVTMWMENTYIPLDMLFMNGAGTVTHLAINAQPLSRALISSGGPVNFVLELNGGAIARYGIKVGDRVEHPLIKGRTP